MANIEIIRRQQLIRQAEGYLDLIMCLEDRWMPDDSLVQSMSGKALAALDQVDPSAGRRSHIAFLRGQAFRITAKYDLAIQAFEESLENDSQNIHIYLGMAWCFKRMGNIYSAIQCLSTAVGIEPTNGLIRYNLACYWALLGDVSKACPQLAAALELNPDLRSLIEDESDFDLIRKTSEFINAISVIV